MIKPILNMKYSKASIIAIIVALILWWLLPHIHIGQSYPFQTASARIIILLLIGMAFAAKAIISKISADKTVLLQIVPWCKQAIQKSKQLGVMGKVRGKQKWQQSVTRFNNSQDRRQTHRLPWYVIMGAPQSGKSAVLQKSGLHSMQADQLGKEAEYCCRQFNQYQWCFTTDAVFIDTDITNMDNAAPLHKKFTRYLRKCRKAKPLSGIILTFSIADLLLCAHEERQKKINYFAQKIRSYHQSLNVQVPIYLIFTKCDLVSGFTEFFNDLSQEELTQVWGMTFNINDKQNKEDVINHFNSEFQQLMSRCQKRVLWSLDSEKTQEGRELIHAFPQQMQLFKRPIITMISELYAALKAPKAIQMRGIYFASCQQTDTPIDFLLAAIGKQYQLQHEPTARQIRREEGYFLVQLFNDVILSEGKIIGENIKRQRLKKIAYKTCIITSPLILLCGIISMTHAYQSSKKVSTTLQQQLLNYNDSLNALKPDDRNIVNSLPALNTLQAAYNSTHSQGWVSSFFIANHELQYSTYHALLRNIHSLFLPRVATYLESQLNNSQSDDARDLYVMLKGYLAFSPRGYTQASTIVAPMESYWNVQFHDDRQTHTQLSHYINMAATEQMDMLPLNRPLINKVRLRLQQIVPSERAYALLNIKSATSDIADMDFPSVIGTPYSRWFVDNRQQPFISRLYTANGYRQVYAKQYLTIANQVSQDNIEIGLDQQSTQSASAIQNQVALTYNSTYIQAWEKALDNINIKPVDNAKQLLSLLTDLSGNDSPMKQLLNIIDSNTSPIKDKQINVNQRFLALNQYTDNLSSKATYGATLSALKQLKDSFNNIEQSNDKAKSYFLAAQDFIHNDTKNPLIKLSIISEQSPEPVKRWLNSIIQSSWNIMMKNTMQYINNAWTVDVMTEFNDNVKHHYPVYALASTDMTTDNFSHFFGTKGTLQQFFNAYLASFVKTDSVNWSVMQVHGQSLPLSNQQVKVFQQAHTIIKHFFPDGKLPHMELTIQPRTLARNAANIHLAIGDHYISYEHGPRTPMHLTWPLPSESLESNIILTDFRGNHYSHHAFGPWAMFKVLNSSGFNIYLAADGHTILQTNLGGYSASFNLNCSAPIGAMKLRDLRHFRLSRQLLEDKS